jgi:hypothetical protein
MPCKQATLSQRHDPMIAVDYNEAEHSQCSRAAYSNNETNEDFGSLAHV